MKSYKIELIIIIHTPSYLLIIIYKYLFYFVICHKVRRERIMYFKEYFIHKKKKIQCKSF